MKFRKLFPLILLLLSSLTVSAMSFDEFFTDATLRLDYIFAGDSVEQRIYVDELRKLKGWAGRRHHLDEFPVHGNGQLVVKDAESGRTLYCHSFSTLFQEWQGTPEAAHVKKAFENVFLVPYPKKPVDVTVKLFDFHLRVTAEMTHRVDPADILIKPAEGKCHAEKVLWKGGSPEECIDVVILAEGYTQQQMPLFYERAQQACDALFSHEPFKAMKKKFNVYALGLPSENSGVSVPREKAWKKTAVDSHFDTFYSDRYLTTLHLKHLHDQLAGVPYEHIIILANTSTYGGGGIYNSYNLTSTEHGKFMPVVVHEFGHSFAGLADEYFYDDQYTEFYYPDVEPWEANITTMKDFASKWKDLKDKGKAGLIEGGGYQSKGVWRAFENCRMKTNEAPEFCKVCQRELKRVIEFYTNDK